MEESKNTSQQPVVENQHLADRIAGKVDELGNPINQGQEETPAAPVEAPSGTDFLAENELDVKDEEVKETVETENPAAPQEQPEAPSEAAEENKQQPAPEEQATAEEEK